MISNTSLFAVLSIALMLKSTNSARILAVFQFPSYSHQIVFQQIWKALAERGHDLVVVTPYPLKDTSLTNLREIDVSYIKQETGTDEKIENIMSKDDPSTDIMEGFYKVSLKYQELILQSEEFQSIYNSSNEKFDLVMVEALHPGMYALAGKFKCPSIGVSSLGVVTAVHGSIGNTNHPLLYPDMNLGEHSDLNFVDKIRSLYFMLWLDYYYNYVVMAESDTLAKKYLGGDWGSLKDVARDVSALFINTNPIIYNPRPVVPTVVELRGIHLRPPKSLEPELQEILDGSKQGVVYVSFGSNVKSSNLATSLKNNLIKAFGELPYTVIWKWESESIPNKPENIYNMKWIPQQDILAHKNVKVFVTQGGLQSVEEAISREVPMVGLPFIGDQVMNVNQLERHGVAVELNHVSVSAEDLKKAIVEVAENPSYKERIREINKIIWDQPMNGLERAIWWTEYVIRHNGTKLLKSPALKVSWIEYLFIDVFMVLIVACLLPILIIQLLLFK